MKNTYKNDTDILNFDGELDLFLAFLREGLEKFNDAICIYRVANRMSSTFPNIEIILRIFLTVPISNALGERLFSALKIVKYYRRRQTQQ